MNIQKIERRKLIIDMNVIFPPPFTAEQVAGIIREYITLIKFCEGMPAVSVYPANTRIVLNPISLASNLNDIKQ